MNKKEDKVYATIPEGTIVGCKTCGHNGPAAEFIRLLSGILACPECRSISLWVEP